MRKPFRRIEGVAAASVLATALLLASCKSPTQDAARRPQTLAEARSGFATKIKDDQEADDPPPEPPPSVFSLVRYPSPAGQLAAYVTPRPADGGRRPAIVWITGGFSNGIGEGAWAPADASNDQSARAFREAGIVLMLPSLRGGSGNPGQREAFFGEVDDVVAAGEYLLTLDYVDPDRVYLGGHSTGGTLALLVAELSTRFRSVFAFGPVAVVTHYGDSVAIDPADTREVQLRSPVYFCATIQSPTWIIEGANAPSNARELVSFAAMTKGAPVHTFAVPHASHFSVLAPVTTLLAQKIVGDTGATAGITLADAELARAVRGGE